jgi:hypothetical protein
MKVRCMIIYALSIALGVMAIYSENFDNLVFVSFLIGVGLGWAMGTEDDEEEAVRKP